jgi:hypothetical protein
VALAITASGSFAQPKDTKLSTKVYNIKPALNDSGKSGSVQSTDALIKLILEMIPFGEPKPDGPQIIERDGGKLEVRATADTHSQIADLLAALERLNDLAVDIQADVYELDAATYAKFLKVFPNSGKSHLLFATGESEEKDAVTKNEKILDEATKILKTGRAIQSSKNRLGNGSDSTAAARLAVVPFTSIVGEPIAALRNNPLFAKEGFSLTALPVVSADRRFVRMKLAEQSTMLTGMRKRELDRVNGKPIVAQTPELEDLGATASTVVADGGQIIFKLAYAPKDKVWIVVLKPTIFIQAENQ